MASASGTSRRSRKKARTRAAIFEAALALFERDGFEPVTVARICAAADVARATFFLHYPSKSALLVELDRRLAAELRRRLGAPRGSAVSEYRTVADLLAERWPRPSGLLEALLRETARADTASTGRASGGQALRDVVEDVVRRGQRRGELRRNVSPRLAATVFLSASAAVLSGGVFADGETTLEENRNQLLHAVLHGLLEPKPRLKWRRPTTREGRAHGARGVASPGPE